MHVCLSERLLLSLSITWWSDFTTPNILLRTVTTHWSPAQLKRTHKTRPIKTKTTHNAINLHDELSAALNWFGYERWWSLLYPIYRYIRKVACELTLNAQVKRLFTFNCNSTVGWTAAEMIVAIYRTFIGTMRLTWIFIFGLEHDSIGVFVEKCYIPYEYIIGRFEMCNKMILLDLGKRKFSLVLHQKWLGGGIKRMMQIQFFCKPKLQ